MTFDRAMSWYDRATGHHTLWSADRIAAERTQTISVCLPARDEAATIGPIIVALLPLLENDVIDELVVVDDSIDGTDHIARELGATVHKQRDLCAEYGPVRGKGDAMWRALSVLEGDVVCFLDADSQDFGSHYACGLVGPIACGIDTQFVKGFYRRPWQAGDVRLAEGGGRVTELCARPLLNAFFPELAGVRQPLAGEVAARRDLLMRLPFATGYAVDVALLIDAWRAVGLAAMAQIDLDVRQNRHRSLPELGPMASDVLQAVLKRVERDGRLLGAVNEGLLIGADSGATIRAVAYEERPPMEALRPQLRAL